MDGPWLRLWLVHTVAFAVCLVLLAACPCESKHHSLGRKLVEHVGALGSTGRETVASVPDSSIQHSGQAGSTKDSAKSSEQQGPSRPRTRQSPLDTPQWHKMMGAAVLEAVKSAGPVRVNVEQPDTREGLRVTPVSGPAVGVSAAQLPSSVSDDARGEAGVQLAARQALFDYGVVQGLRVLQEQVARLPIPNISRRIDVPVIGGVDLQIYDIVVKHFDVASKTSTLNIMNGSYHLNVLDVDANITFGWHWETRFVQGTGDAELFLHGGDIDYTFMVLTDPALAKPQLQVMAARSEFEQLDISLHADSTNWLYQALLKLFGGVIRKRLQTGITRVLEQDLPEKVNSVLATLPTELVVTGLPIDVAFEYSIYTLTYVLIKGYGDISTAASPSAMGVVTGGPGQQHLANARRQAAAAGMAKQPTFADSEEQCPFTVTSALPLLPEAISAGPQMGSLYLHQSILNCVLWGLHRQGVLRLTLVDGSIEQLHLTSELLSMLIPELPKRYPRQLLRIDITAMRAPTVQFSEAQGADLQVEYRIAISIANETLGNPEVAVLATALNVTALLDWDATTVSSVLAKHVVESSSLPVPVDVWDNTVGWFIQSYGSLYPLHVLFDMFVSTPISSTITLLNTEASSVDGWFFVSSDVLVDLPKA